ncbi:GvpL/GvpF family gas vesicle protein [Spartinivicinus poritis]|uniref:GvpL/GvpF family gas vesicle protein n=1 Tax=Spartinivicinus poritis TaxID=2994640 RepID=A0ABT5U533_9GAMM|nr:GvpL/GvpF family gas vesicle protein [Spartinivicinus sp. A2-2]MDE1461467.1 GvpL/GvpF family gas vesicle protein [Spartinivicinus sp. A2-2]
MKCLLYCLFQKPQLADVVVDLPVGVQGEKVLVANYLDLFAAYSFYTNVQHQQVKLANSESSQKTPVIREALVFSQIIEMLHQQYTLIPIRFGCYLDNEQQLIKHLNNNYQQYTTQLASLNNLTEFSIKAILPTQTSKIKSERLDQGALKDELSNDNKQVAGKAYLQTRQSYYNETTNNIELNLLIERINGTFQGLYYQCQSEVNTQAGQRILSIYYLVAKKTIKSFNMAFQQLVSTSSNCQKLLLSGPWPPYNFVTKPVIKPTILVN